MFAGTLSAGTMIVTAGYATSAPMVVVCMCLAGGSTGFVYAGFQVNILDIAPRFAGIVMGICNSIGSVAGFLSPMLVGFITQNKVRLSVAMATDKLKPILRSVSAGSG